MKVPPAGEFSKILFFPEDAAPAVNVNRFLVAAMKRAHPAPKTFAPLADTPAFEAASAALAKHGAAAIPGAGEPALDRFARAVIAEHELEEPFYIVDLGVIMRRYVGWVQTMPRVTPFYAVKCCPDPAFLSVLSALGAGFDVASQKELQMVLDAGMTNPDRIVYANPCKMPKQLAFAASAGVKMTTFDSADELLKIADIHPGAACILRIKADDPNARCSFGHKFGALLSEVPELLRTGTRLGLDMAGVSFHIGSGGASDPTWMCHAVVMARQVFDVAAEMGIQMRLLDIGGGFSGGLGSLEAVAHGPAGLNACLERLFPAAEGVRVISEPGRYFAEATATLACNVYGRRVRGDEEGPLIDYWITDGVYGSMNCILYDHAVLTTRPLADPTRHSSNAVLESSEPIRSTVFGPTCDGLDTLLRGTPLPELQCGDWLLFPNMGAYTWSAGSNFNGFGRGEKSAGGCTVACFYVLTDADAPAGAVADEEVAGENETVYLGGPSSAAPDTPEASETSEMSGDESESAMASPSSSW